MSNPEVPQNIIPFPGFPEVPPDAFEMLDEDIELLQLVRYYKSYCPHCYTLSHVSDHSKQNIICNTCEIVFSTLIQGIVRGFLVRQKLQRLRKKELVHRIFMSRGFDGIDFVDIISTYL